MGRANIAEVAVSALAAAVFRKARLVNMDLLWLMCHLSMNERFMGTDYWIISFAGLSKMKLYLRGCLLKYTISK